MGYSDYIAEHVECDDNNARFEAKLRKLAKAKPGNSDA
jgi:hypothetical protein